MCGPAVITRTELVWPARILKRAPWYTMVKDTAPPGRGVLVIERRRQRRSARLTVDRVGQRAGRHFRSAFFGVERLNPATEFDGSVAIRLLSAATTLASRVLPTSLMVID